MNNNGASARVATTGTICGTSGIRESDAQADGKDTRRDKREGTAQTGAVGMFRSKYARILRGRHVSRGRTRRGVNRPAQALVPSHFVRGGANSSFCTTGGTSRKPVFDFRFVKTQIRQLNCVQQTFII